MESVGVLRVTIVGFPFCPGINNGLSAQIRQSHKQHKHKTWHLLPTLLLRIALHVVKRVAISTHATSVRWSSIAMQHVKRNIDQSIRNRVRNVLQNYTMKNYSKSTRLVKNVQYAFSPYQLMHVNQASNHAVVKLYAKVVLLPLWRKHMGEGK